MDELGDYGHARQVTLFEAGEAVAEVLTSDTASTAARLVHQWPRARRGMRFGR